MNPGRYPEIKTELISRDANFLGHEKPIRVTSKVNPSRNPNSVNGDRVEGWASTRTNNFHPVVMDLKDLQWL